MLLAGILGALSAGLALASLFFLARWIHRKRRGDPRRPALEPAERLMLDTERAAAGLVAEPEVRQALSEEPGDPLASLERAHRYAREIVPRLDAGFYLGLLGGPLRTIVSRLFRIRIHYQDENALRERLADSTPVFVLNHRSNLDYLVASTALADRAIVSFAVGEWARYWPLEPLLRTVGGYFVRRGSGNRLYRAVLAAHVRRSIEEGVPQAFFIEGNLSLDGALRAPRLGLVDYTVRGFCPEEGRDVAFIPTALNYDRVLEDRNLQIMKTRGRSPSRFRYLQAVSGFWLHQLWLVLNRRWRPFGHANVAFGQPLSLREWTREHGVDPRHTDRETRFAAVARLGDELMNRIARVMPVLPAPLMATVVTRAGSAGITPDEAREEAFRLLGVMSGTSDLPGFGDSDWRHWVECGIRSLSLRRLIVSENGRLRCHEAQRDLVEYYANSIAHLAERPPAAG